MDEANKVQDMDSKMKNLDKQRKEEIISLLERYKPIAGPIFTNRPQTTE